MKIVGNIVKILIVVLLVYVLLQNAGQTVNLKFFTLYQQDMQVSLLLLLTLGVGAILGAVLVSFSIIHLRNEIRILNKRKD